MIANIEDEVVRIDASLDFNEDQTLLQLLSAAVTHTESGVVDVFRVLVREELSMIGQHTALYERLLHSALSLKVLVLCTTGGKPATQAMDGVVIPDAILNSGDRIRMLIVEDNIGVYFGADRGTPQALAVWPEDELGLRTMEIIEDAIIIPEVFSAIFESTKATPHRAFSIGTRQAWFGRFPADAIADALREVGATITGGDSFSALERRPPEWDTSDHLCGKYSEEDLLLDGTGLSLVYGDTKKSVTNAMKWFGLKSGFSVPKRVARFEDAQLGAVEDLSQKLRFADETVSSLVSGVKASDGFDDNEAEIIERAGIRLYRDDNRRQVLKDVRTSLLESVIHTILLALSQEQAISPYFGRLDKTIAEIEPRSSEQIRLELEEKLLISFIDRLDRAKASAPRGFGMRLAKKFALLLAERWFQLLLVVGGLIGVIGALDHIFDEQIPNVIKDFAVFGSLRQELRIMSEIIFVLIVVVLIASAMLLFYADSKIKEWGQRLAFTEVQRHLDAHEAFIRNVALNDWILSKTRRSVIEPLQLLRDAVLREVLIGLSGVLIDDIKNQPLDYDTHSFNPAVRKTFQAGAHIGIFKNLPQVKKVLSKDIVWIIKRPIESHGYSLLGASAETVGPRIVTEVRERLERYVRSVFRYGVYSPNHLVDENEGERERQKLMDQYWSDADSINVLLNGIVLTKESEPIVQFIQPESLSHLDSALGRTVFIRFAPKTSKLDEVSISEDQRATLREVIFTRSAEIGGILRLIGYREGTIF